jgi:hypothetical protein
MSDMSPETHAATVKKRRSAPLGNGFYLPSFDASSATK